MYRRYAIRRIDFTRFDQSERDRLRQFCRFGGMVAFRPLQADLTRAQRQHRLTGRPARISRQINRLAAQFGNIFHAVIEHAPAFQDAIMMSAD